MHRWIFIVTLISSNLSAQDRSAIAFYLTPKGDTLRGEIQFRDNYNDGFRFRKGHDEQFQTITAEEASGFTFVNGDSYVKVDKDVANTIGSPIFMKVAGDGEIDLLYHQSKPYLYSSKGVFPIDKKNSGNTSNESVKYQQRNIGYFNILFSDCTSLQETSKTAKTNKEGLQELLNQYHACKSIPFNLPHQRRPRFLFGVSGGLATAKASSKNVAGEKPYLNGVDLGSSSDMTFGLLFIRYGRKQSSVLSFQTELLYASASLAGNSVLENNGGGNVTRNESDLRLEYDRILVRIGPRLTLRSNTINPYIAGGLTFARTLSVESSLVEQRTINNFSETIESEFSQSVNGSGVWLSAGLMRRFKNGLAIMGEVSWDNAGADYASIKTLYPRVGIAFATR